MKMLSNAILLLMMASSFQSFAHGNNDVSPRIVEAILIAIDEAKKCKVDLDAIEMIVSIDGPNYKIEFVAPGKRGGGAVVIIDRKTATVDSFRCLQ